jgi:hypothetical protein
MSNPILWLDDSPERAAIQYQRWPDEKRNRTIWAQTAQEAIDVLKEYELDEAYLDHDLGGTQFQDTRAENCGTEVVRWLEKNLDTKHKTIKFIVHSHNIPAGKRMTERLMNLGLDVKYIPFGMTTEIEVCQEW